MKKSLLIPLLLTSLVVAGQTKPSNSSTKVTNGVSEDWKTFDGANYSIQYPSGWELDQSGQRETSIILFSPFENESDKFIENVNLIIQDLSGYNVDLDKYIEFSEIQVKIVITNPSLIESSRIRSAKPEFHKMIYNGDQGIFRLKYEQYFWIVNQHAYILTLTCELSKYPDYKETGERILNSFVFKN